MNDLHHLHVRKRIYKNLEKYPNKNWFKRALDYVMYGVAIATPIALFPQVFRLFTYQDAAGLSIITWSMLGCINILWIVYGIVHKERPILIANVLVGILNWALIYGILLYR